MSTKSETNKKWTSTEEYRDNYDHIFGKKQKSPCEDCESKQLKTIGCICVDSIDYEMMNRNTRYYEE